MATAKPAKSAEAEAPVAEAEPPKKSKKKLIIVLALVILLLAGVGGGAAFFMMKKKSAAAVDAATEDDGHATHQEKEEAPEHSGPPVFVPLDPFVVNLADKGSDRYAQVSVSLQVADAKVGDELKLYMPAIKHNILMVLAHKTSEELLEKSGKKALAEEILEEATRPLIEGRDPKKDKEKTKHPILKVHFANFIIQ